MYRKHALFTLLITLTVITTLPSITYAAETTLYIDPPIVAGLEVGDSFQVNVTVSDVTELYAWQFSMFYKNDVVNATSVTEGPFLLTHPDPEATTFFLNPIFTDNYNETHGLILVANTLMTVEGGVNGTGTLATITFRIVGQGTTRLHLPSEAQHPNYYARLVDSTRPIGNIIPHTIEDGIVSLGLRDIAITNTRTSKTFTNDTNLYIDVTVTNNGQSVETFDITAYANASPIGTQTITDLSPAATTTVTITWNTVEAPKGNYTITTQAGVPDDITPEDNTYLDGWVVETIMGDLDGNYAVNIIDIAKVAAAFGSQPGDPEWNPNADLDGNDVVNILDVSKAASNYGKSIDP